MGENGRVRGGFPGRRSRLPALGGLCAAALVACPVNPPPGPEIDRVGITENHSRHRADRELPLSRGGSVLGNRDDLDPDAYTGVQVDSRRSFGYGMFVFVGAPNVTRQPVVTGFFAQSIQPPTGFYPDLVKLWRWTELDVEFVPWNTSPQREQVECAGAFPAAACQEYRADGGQLGVPLTKVAGTYTNNRIAGLTAQIGVNGTPQPGVTDWASLVRNTGTGLPWAYGNDWGLPANLPLPDREDLKRSVALNYFRAGDVNGTRIERALGVSAPFIPQGPPNPPYGFDMTNEQFLWSKNASGGYDFDPHDGKFHTYTVVWTPQQVRWYIDAPNEGTGVDAPGVRPVKVMNALDYPDIALSGPDYPGGTLEWNYFGGSKRLGDNVLMFNVWPAAGWGGLIPPGFTEATSYLRTVAFYPLVGTAPGPTDPITAASFNLDRSSPAVFRADFSGCTGSPTWRYDFMRNFVAEKANAKADASLLTKNPELIACVAAPADGQGALSYRMVPVAAGQARSWFTLTPGSDPNDPTTFMGVDIDVPGVAYASARSGSVIGSQPFWAPPGTRATVTARNLSTGTTQSCRVDFGANHTYTAVATQPPCPWLPAGPQTNGDIGVNYFK